MPAAIPAHAGMLSTCLLGSACHYACVSGKQPRHWSVLSDPVSGRAQSLGAVAAAAPAAPADAGASKSITGTTMYGDGSDRGRMLVAAATHPAVIWQSHLLDVTPASWPSMKVCCAQYRMSVPPCPSSEPHDRS